MIFLSTSETEDRPDGFYLPISIAGGGIRTAVLAAGQLSLKLSWEAHQR
jgi:hypothetical protein